MINRQVHIIISIVNLDYLNRILWKLSRYFADSSSGNVIQCSCSSVTTCSSRRLSAPWAGRSRPPGWPGSPAPGRRSAHWALVMRLRDTTWHRVTGAVRGGARLPPVRRHQPLQRRDELGLPPALHHHQGQGQALQDVGQVRVRIQCNGYCI